LITLDVMMPGQSGLDLLHDVAKKYPDTAVIMLTATGQTQTTTDALTHGACAYLLKPFLREELIFHVRKALERRQLVIDKREYTLHLEEKVREQTRAIRRSQEDVIHRLACASSCRDEETEMHIRRTGLLCELLAKAAGWSAEEAENLRMAAPMHDVGKIAISDAILRRAGELTAEEFEVMKTHTTIGAKMLAGSDSPVLQMAAEIALNHHERWDGGGYPQGTAGHAIPESARIMAIVDVYDDLSHDRASRPALPEEEVLARMQQEAGTRFDALLLALLLSHSAEMRGIAEQYPDKQGEAELIGAAPCLIS
jgi:putative two-component system response regulator